MNGIDTFLDINNAHLRVNNGNVQASTFVLDQIDFIASSNASTTVGFNNTTTAFLAVSNIEVGTANLFVDTTTSNVGIGTNTPLDTLHINGGTLIGGHILPTQHEQFDIGSADAKIRHLFLSDNSLWLGDETRISFTEGKMKFRRRKKNILPRGLLTIGATAGHANEIATRDAALAHAGKSDITDMKLENWLGYAKTLDATKDISDVFTQDENEYEASAASEAFTELGTTTIASSQHVAIATTAPPQYPLDVEGDINFSGNLRKNGELFGWTGESSNLFYVNGNVGVGTSLPQGTMHISSGGTGDCKLILEADTDNNGAGSGSGGSNTYTIDFTTGTAIPSTSKVGGWHTYTYGDFVLPTDFTKSNLSISVTWNGTMPIRFALGQYVGFHLNKLDSNGNEHSPAINANFVFNDPGQGISGSGGGPTIYNGAIRTSSTVNNGRWLGGDTIRASMGIFRHYFNAGHTCSIAITYDRTSSSDENDNPMILFRQDGGIYESSVRMSDNRLEFVNSASTSNGFAFYLGNQESSTGTSGLDAAEEKVTIDSAGNLGIGQTTPTQKLDVAGTVKATAFEGDGSALTGISGGGQWTYAAGSGSGTQQLVFDDQASGTAFTGTLSGNSNNTAIRDTGNGYIRVTQGGTSRIGSVYWQTTLTNNWEATFDIYILPINYGGADDMRFVFYATSPITSNDGATGTNGHGGAYMRWEYYGGDLVELYDHTATRLSQQSVSLQMSGWMPVTVTFNNGVMTSVIKNSSGTTLNTTTHDFGTAYAARYNTPTYVAVTGRSGGVQAEDRVRNITINALNVASPAKLTRMSTNVGIDIATPTQKLDVNGTVKATAFEGDGSALTGISSGGASFGGTTRPLWRASYTSTNGNRNTGTVPFNRAEINQRSGYSTSTGLFTAPVAGHYWVYGQMYSHSSTGKNEICFIINGSSSINRLGMAYGVSGDTIPHFVNMPLMTTVWLNVNDTIGVYVRDAYAHYNGVGVAYFGGHLLA
jgi:hypothetical protein